MRLHVELISVCVSEYILIYVHSHTHHAQISPYPVIHTRTVAIQEVSRESVQFYIQCVAVSVDGVVFGEMLFFVGIHNRCQWLKPVKYSAVLVEYLS